MTLHRLAQEAAAAAEVAAPTQADTGDQAIHADLADQVAEERRPIALGGAICSLDKVHHGGWVDFCSIVMQDEGGIGACQLPLLLVGKLIHGNRAHPGRDCLATEGATESNL